MKVGMANGRYQARCRNVRVLDELQLELSRSFLIAVQASNHSFFWIELCCRTNLAYHIEKVLPESGWTNLQ